MNIDFLIQKLNKRELLTLDEFRALLLAYLDEKRQNHKLSAEIVSFQRQLIEMEKELQNAEDEIKEAERRSDYWQDMYEMYFNTWIERG